MLSEPDSFSIEHFYPSRLALSIMENDKHFTIFNHLGDLSVYSHDKDDNLFQDALTKLKLLIDICLNSLINKINLEDQQKISHDFFKVKKNRSLFL